MNRSPTNCSLMIFSEMLKDLRVKIDTPIFCHLKLLKVDMTRETTFYPQNANICMFSI